MENKNNASGLEELPAEILANVLNFMNDQEKIDTIQQLRLVCKKLKSIVSSEDFLKIKVESQILYAKSQGLGSVIDQNLVLQNQINDWQKLKSTILNIYENFYNSLPQIKEIKNLISQIQQSPLPATNYIRTFSRILVRPKVLLASTILLFLIMYSVKYTVAEIPKASPIITQRNQLERELIAEGCTFEYGRHGSAWISSCNNTVKASQWTNLENEVAKHIVGPVILDTVSGFLFIAAITFSIVICNRVIKNQPNSYEDLPSINLQPNQHVIWTNIRNKFPNHNPITPNIKDIRVALEKLLSDKDLPTDANQAIQNLSKEYLTLINTLNTELKKLEEYKTNNKLVMTSRLSNGELKVSFRGKVYAFFFECQKLNRELSSSSAQNSEESEQTLIHRNRRPKLRKDEERSFLAP